MVDLLPEIEVVAEDAFNSSPSDPKMMGPEALERFNRGEELPVARVKTPLVRIGPPCAASVAATSFQESCLSCPPDALRSEISAAALGCLWEFAGMSL